VGVFKKPTSYAGKLAHSRQRAQTISICDQNYDLKSNIQVSVLYFLPTAIRLRAIKKARFSFREYCACCQGVGGKKL
jgi:hypothetical protein